jgi:hypothetical protein
MKYKDSMTIELKTADQMWTDVHSMEVRDTMLIDGGAVLCRTARRAIDDLLGTTKRMPTGWRLCSNVSRRSLIARASPSDAVGSRLTVES